MSLQNIVLRLLEFWESKECVIVSGYDGEVGAGTMTPDTFFRVLGSRPCRVAYWQPSRRPDDGRYAQNPNRVQKHNQFQVILKPIPSNCQELFLESLIYLGVDVRIHDIRFDEDDWASPSLGAWGVGWQIMCDGLEITQFTYFQQAGGIDLNPNALEITYGLERLAMFLDNKSNLFELEWGNGASYAALKVPEEQQFSAYNFERADIEFLRQVFTLYREEAGRMLTHKLYLPAYDYLLKCSHTFNILDSRKAISVAERTALMSAMRNLANQIALQYLDLTEGAAPAPKSPGGKGENHG